MQLLYVIHFFILSDLYSAGSVSLGIKSPLQERETIGRMISSAVYARFEERKKERARTREARERKKESGRERNGGIERGDCYNPSIPNWGQSLVTQLGGRGRGHNAKGERSPRLPLFLFSLCFSHFHPFIGDSSSLPGLKIGRR